MTVVENQRLEAVEEKLGALEGKVDKVLVALTGDTFGLNGGIVSKINSLESRVAKIETLKNRIVWVATGMGFTGGFTLVKVAEYLLPYLKK